MRLGRLSLAASAALALAPPASARAADVQLQPLAPGEVLLEAVATGYSRRPPDVVTVTVGVVTTGRTARAAMADNAAKADRLMAAIRAAGIEANDVQTTSFSVQPMSNDAMAEREGRLPKVMGYQATNNLELHLRDVARAGEVLDILFEAGADTVEGPRFALSDPAAAQREARTAAVAAARAQAESYAAALGMRVGRMLRVEEGGYTGDEAIVITGTRLRRSSLAPGEIATRIAVTIDYALVPR